MNTKFSLLILLAFGALVALNTSCIDTDSQSEASESTATSEEIVLFTWPEYIDPEVVAKFTEETGISVKIETFDSAAQMKGYLMSKPGRYDLVVTDNFYIAELSEVELISKVEKADIPNISNFNPAFLNLEFDPENDYSIPYMWGSVLVAYRSDYLENPEESWSLLKDRSLNGKIALIEDKQDAFGFGLLADGFSLQSDNVEELEQISAELLKHAKEMDPQYLDLEDIKSQLVTGDLWAALCYSGDAMVLADENENIDCFIPKEGAALWLDSFAVVKDAPNRRNAHLFINFMSRGEVAGQNANYLWTATPNKEAEPFLDPEMKEDSRVFLPEETFANCEFYALPTPEIESILNKGMKAVMDVIHNHVALQGEQE